MGWIMTFRTIAIAAVASLVVAGCSGPNAKEDTGTLVGAVAGGIIGNQFGKGQGRALATAAGVVVGGIVGNSIGRDLDERDRLLARDAEFAALERGESGEPVEWRNPDTGRYGEVVPQRAYERGRETCREFEHRVFIEGRRQTMTGTACRNPDGTWRNVG